MMEGFSIIAPGINFPDSNSNIRRTLSIVGGVSGEQWTDLKAIEYKNLKKQTVNQILEILEIHIPGIKKHIKTIDLATPHTFHRYTQNPNGAILGFKTECGNHRKLLKINRFPIRNIFLASAWTNRLGGFMQTIKSGILAAQKSIDYLNRS
jgi:prolycopene isomerase